MPTPQDAAIARLQPARDRSRAEWTLLRARLGTITPQAAEALSSRGGAGEGMTGDRTATLASRLAEP